MANRKVSKVVVRLDDGDSEVFEGTGVSYFIDGSDIVVTADGEELFRRDKRTCLGVALQDAE